MTNLLEDIQCAGSDTQPPMLDRTDFVSWKQRIRLYCQGKEKGVNILKSIDEGSFQMGTIRDTIAEGTEGAQQLGPERTRVYSDLSPKDKDMYNVDIRATNILLQGLPKDIYTLINHYTEAKYIWDNVKILLEAHQRHAENQDDHVQNAVELKYYSQSSTTPPSTHLQLHFAENTQLDSGLSPTDNLIENLTNTLALLTQSYKTYLPQTNNQLRTSSNTRNQATVQDGRVVVQNVQGRQNRVQGNNAQGEGASGYEGAQNRENGVALDDEQLLFIIADDCDAFDSDVDEAPTAQKMFMANLSSADPIYDEASPSYDSDILSEVPDHDNYQDAVCEHHEVHEMHDDYEKDNAVPVVQSNVSSIPNDAYKMILNDIYEPSAN
ncbi:hypothetical protein Tco_0801984 [Tanacetum coccineum]|uniref:Integrase, catalytic region, zinc finger, CCHC-type, peptidase aspartic, catalytic n=1 Tax=Tanacetum coccineum TaxID=301880 RepID=A0ABQ5A0F0_9ASTR